MLKRFANYFSKGELILWGASVVLISVSFFGFDRSNSLAFIASLIGATSLIFNAKGNPFGQFLMIIFGLIYGYISYSFTYYSEMITYVGMTAPMALLALISWLRHPYKNNRSEVAVNRIGKKDVIIMLALSIAVTLIFYYVLAYFNTANLIPSTLSVTTSFVAVYLTFRRSPYFALAYAANDIVLIALWIMATAKDISYLSVLICFVVFLANDLYGFFSWLKMEKRQLENE
ncbi:MAG: nicotinamide mononucleotide transporter [Clostridia bacterium]|nr:nicotinamide mononucleotide transporter [Clostridia bacterium]